MLLSYLVLDIAFLHLSPLNKSIYLLHGMYMLLVHINIRPSMGLPEEIAEAVCYFASDASAYTTGQILTVSGGFGLATPLYGDLAKKENRR